MLFVVTECAFKDNRWKKRLDNYIYALLVHEGVL